MPTLATPERAGWASRTHPTGELPAGSPGPVRTGEAIGVGSVTAFRRARTISHVELGRKSRKCGFRGKKAGEIVCVSWQEMNNIQRICEMPC